MANKIDSNITGLRIAEEASLRVLPGSPKWIAQEPNSYSDFGGQLTTVARNPINPSRQRKKGSVTDLEASGGFNQDVTQTNLTRMLQGFLFADMREKITNQPMNGNAIAASSVSAGGLITFASALAATIIVNSLVYNSGYGVSANNGLKVVSASTGSSVTVTGAAEASPPATAKTKRVGFQFPSADVAITTPGGFPRLTSTVTDMTTLGLIAGEWVFLGSDSAGSGFVNNVGFARINAISTNYIEFDKTDWTPQAEAGTGKTIQMFFGDIIRNEFDPNLIKRRTYQLERTLGSDADGVQSEYLVGAVPNELTVNVPQADKINADLTFVAVDNEQRTGLDGTKAGTRLSEVAADAINTSSDFARIKLAIVDPVSANPTALFAYATELTLSVNNNATPNKALGVLGAFDVSVGTFEVGGSIDAYFSNIEAVQAVRNNADVTLDMIAVKKNAGVLFDIPLLSLGDGRLNVEQDNPITLKLENNAAESKFGYTLLFQSFSYLPTAAEVY